MKYLFFLLKCFLVLPHLFAFFCINKTVKNMIKADVEEMNRRCKTNGSLAYFLVTQKPYRNLFYYRIGRFSTFLRLFLPPYSMFFIGDNIKSFGGGAFVLNHPYGSIINAKSIGENFTLCQLTTIGNKSHGRNDLVPTIGDNVSLGANVSIIGDITIGNNVIIGAGSVVVSDVPCNCVVAGNPAKIIKYLKTEY